MIPFLFRNDILTNQQNFVNAFFLLYSFTLIRFTLVRLPDLNYNSFMTSMTGCLLFPQKGFYFL